MNAYDVLSHRNLVFVNGSDATFIEAASVGKKEY
jgi:hypothetical protein